MISGVHAMLYSRAADQVRAFFRDVLEVSAIGVEVAPGERIGIYQPRHPSPR